MTSLMRSYNDISLHNFQDKTVRENVTIDVIIYMANLLYLLRTNQLNVMSFADDEFVRKQRSLYRSRGDQLFAARC